MRENTTTENSCKIQKVNVDGALQIPPNDGHVVKSSRSRISSRPTQLDNYMETFERRALKDLLSVDLTPNITHLGYILSSGASTR